MTSPNDQPQGGSRRSLWSRLQSGAILAGAGFLLGISVFSLAVPLTSIKAAVIKLAMGVIVGFFAFLIGLFLSRRVSLWGLVLAATIAIPTLQGIYQARLDLQQLSQRSVPSRSIPDNFSIVLSDIPRPVLMDLPSGFRLASTAEEKAKRDRLLNFFRLNPAFKGSYEEVLLRAWTSASSRPQIIISTLQSARNGQGAITKDFWAQLKHDFEAGNFEEQVALRHQFRKDFHDGSPVDIGLKEQSFSATSSPDPNSVVILSRNQLEVAGTVYDDLSARKIIYHNGFLVTVGVVIAADSPDALSELQRLVDAIHVRDI